MKKWFAVIGVAIVLIAIALFFLQKKEPEPANITVQFVSGTEYTPGQQGQVIVEARFSNSTNAFSSSGACNVSVWYPNRTIFLNAVPTSAAPSENEYVDFIVPETPGVYEYQAVCSLKNGKTGIISKSFHVSANEVVLKVFSDLNYIAESQGKVFAEARYLNGTSAMLDATQCSFGIFYGNGTQYALGAGSPQGDGAAFDFTAPWDEGVYGYQAVCPTLNGIMLAGAGSFMVENSIRAVMPK